VIVHADTIFLSIYKELLRDRWLRCRPHLVYAPRRHQPRLFIILDSLNPSHFQRVPRWFGGVALARVQQLRLHLVATCRSKAREETREGAASPASMAHDPKCGCRMRLRGIRLRKPKGRTGGAAVVATIIEDSAPVRHATKSSKAEDAVE